MTSYVVLARKWRPAQFSDIVGQSHIVRTLMNAIRSNRVHHAYLLTGSRGIGKTSIARIFAKALRCEKAEWQEEVLRSCDQCANCREIASGTSVDVIEIDGASNNGVDAVREIRENAKYLPASGGRKVYIIDEVHMLTTAAFNALLKTLEEPPAHVLFLFATTEPHKIPGTILSRCQRFDLRRVTSAQIQGRLQEVLQAESVPAESGALALIARAADGGMRDALSLLDQVMAFAGQKISVQAARESIGLIEGQALQDILEAVLARRAPDALKLVEQAHRQGHDLRVLTRGLIEVLHAVILTKVGAQTDSIELSEDERLAMGRLASLRELEELELLFQSLHQGVDWIARSPQPKLVLDVLLIKCALAEALVEIGAPAGGGPSGGAIASPGAPVRTAPVSTELRRMMTPEVPVTPAAATAGAPLAPSLPAAPVASAVAKGQISWEGFIAHVRQTRPLLASILENGSPEGELPNASAADADQLLLFFQPSDAYYRDQLQSRIYADQLSLLAKEYFGRVVRLKIELKEIGESVAIRRERERTAWEASARAAAQNHPIIAEARSLFGGDLSPIELIEPKDPSSMGGGHAH